MATSHTSSNGRSPLVNQQSQITSFFSKSSSSYSPLPSLLVSKSNSGNPGPSTKNIISNSDSSPTVSPSNQTKSKKPPLLSAPSAKKCLREQVINKRIRVYWPLDKAWYEGYVKSYDGRSGKHTVFYDDAEEEELDLEEERIEWVDEEKPQRFKRLKRQVSIQMTVGEEDKGEVVETGRNDSEDQDWEKSVDKKTFMDYLQDDMNTDEEDEEERVEEVKTSPLKMESRKRKVSGGKTGFGKKRKGVGELEKDGVEGLSMKAAENVESGWKYKAISNAPIVDTLEKFGQREAEKLPFLGLGRKDATRRRPGDANYNPRTLYLPPDFLKKLSDGQRQWWEFKSKHMDKVIFFKMGKFYELFEMDAHIGAKELDLQYMKGDQPHCGFPEKNFSLNVEKLARKGYRVLVVEQTETPEQLELRRKEKGSKDKVVKREICAVVTKGTLTEGEMLAANPDASYLIAVTESCQISKGNTEERIFGVCVVDVATSRIILGQFTDDSDCNALCCLLSELRPVEIVKPAKLLSPETERALTRHTRNPLVNELLPLSEFWDADRTISELKTIYMLTSNQSVSESTNASNANEENRLGCMPDVFCRLLNSGEGSMYALSALGGMIFYLKQAFLDETLLRYASVELLPSSSADIHRKHYMVLDSAALENLEIFENSKNGDSSGTLYSHLNHCVTAFGKRLLKTWLARPLYRLRSIRERQDAVAGLRGLNLSSSLEFQKELSRLPDMERLLARLFSSSEANGRHANKVVLYEDAAKKQLQEFISGLQGCELMVQACSSLASILENADSSLLHYLLTPGKGLPDINSVLKHFKDGFDWAEANSSGRIIPCEGVDIGYDLSCKRIKEIESSLMGHLKEQRKFLGDPTITYVVVGKEAYLLEVSESLRGSLPQDYELRSSRKGFSRYWNPYIKKLLGELSQVESEKESKLKSILQILIGHFCEHRNMWRQLVSTVAELDVLISLAIASDYYEGATCRPTLSRLPRTNDVPCLNAKGLGHPVLRSDFLGRGGFVPNDIGIGGSSPANFILLTGPNMGGKSTLLRQVCLAVILAQVGADVPAERFDLSPVDRIFVRMGAKDNIMSGQSTFLTELSETASMLSSATRNSLVALDELGRGTATSDGQAIAESVLEYLVHKVQCRGLFSTHYHRLAVDYHNDPKVILCHMACHVGKGDGGLEEVTFLYRMALGACPKSYGVNVARLAGLPDSVLRKAAAKSKDFEARFDKHSKRSEGNLCLGDGKEDTGAITRQLIDVLKNMSRKKSLKRRDVRFLIELQHRARMVLQQQG